MKCMLGMYRVHRKMNVACYRFCRCCWKTEDSLKSFLSIPTFAHLSRANLGFGNSAGKRGMKRRWFDWESWFFQMILGGNIDVVTQRL